MVGPTLQDDLFSILSRFRTFTYALTADITKMYRQVLVDPTQTCLQRILWRDSPNESIKTYELLTLTYGTSSASFLAIAALRKQAEENSTKFPIASKVVLNDFYVDDLVTGANTIQEIYTIKKETIQLLQGAKFELAKWASNVPSLQGQPYNSNHKEFMSSADKQCETRTLGIIWNCNMDQFQFPSVTPFEPLKTITKRSILSRISLIFDPLGLLGPVTLTAKIIMQDLWRLGLDWDESIPLELHTKWKRYEAELPTLRQINVPRRVIPFKQHTRLEIHGFSDASESGYGACIYLRATLPDGSHSVRLLCSKNRVAPLKTLLIPRLELCGALLLAQLVNKISNCLSCKIDSIYLWTDSTIVLAWLQSCNRTWTPFVANRVGEIQQLTAIQNWKHIRSEDNPADPLSRGIMPASLSHLQIWWTGTPWLTLDKKKWPQGLLVTSNQDASERRSKCITTLATNDQDFNIFNRYSRFTRLIRIVAYIFRFFKNARNIGGSIRRSQESITPARIIQPITTDEINHAIQILVKLVQKDCFSKELHSLSNQGIISPNSPASRLSPFIDETGILRVGGRLQSSSLPRSAKHPILLPGRHSLSHLIIMHEHEKHLHAGPQATLAAVRQNYWLVSARDIVRQITRKCTICFRSAPKPASTIMGNLPKPRITVPSRVFENCGVDYAGPYYYKQGLRKNTKLIKCYMTIFVCFATKAVHIELATDMTSEAFLNVFKRFISRRGYPANIYSDNGLNFVGAEHELNELVVLFKNQKFQHEIAGYMSDKNVQWHFISPRAPHHGGLWEAAVKMAKVHISRITKDAHLRYEELQTLLIQVEAILNSRPLTPMSSDPDDLAPLTAGHFLIGGPLTSYPKPSLENLAINRLSRWQHLEQLRQHFWRRWTKEYLHHLQQRNKWQSIDSSIYKGQMVILKEDNMPPLSWPLGRISEIHPGHDGIVRTATIKTTKGSYKRPITRLCLLPFDNEPQS
ncbi:uncharacterized protein LOC114929752 [Nylanderia fulva]|uniref:uncharacterized protein LOC114929752 n=1 Tax=Nylanderia fulva TaxID=613905 RepID=UPI0010FB5816|nr:uncharacterized protein LOC114929752 [Nylanderia fulva]